MKNRKQIDKRLEVLEEEHQRAADMFSRYDNLEDLDNMNKLSNEITTLHWVLSDDYDS